MLEKLIDIEEDESKEIANSWDWLEDFGSWNVPPKPLIPISKHDYYQKTHSNLPKFIEYRQLQGLPDQKHWVDSVRIEWYRDFGIVIRPPAEWTCDDNYHYGVKWTDETSYYLVGCDHKWVELSQQESREIGIDHYGMFCHVYRCPKCGSIDVTDSSG